MASSCAVGRLIIESDPPIFAGAAKSHVLENAECREKAGCLECASESL